jgi:hypothetical protein
MRPFRPRQGASPPWNKFRKRLLRHSILYKNSSNLLYDADKQTIHENYNGWIQRLDNTIRARIAAIG